MRRLIDLDDANPGPLEILHFIAKRERDLAADGFAREIVANE